MSLKQRIVKLEQLTNANTEKPLTRDDWTSDELLAKYFTDPYPQELIEKDALTDWSKPSKSTKKLEDYL
jgi:hypothetical protein